MLVFYKQETWNWVISGGANDAVFFLRYIISFLLDSTLGLVIIWAGIRLSIYIGQKKGLPTIIFGEYGEYSVSLFVMSLFNFVD